MIVLNKWGKRMNKRNIIISVVVVSAILVFFIVNMSTGQEIKEKQQKEMTDSQYYDLRVRAELDAVNRGIDESGQMRKDLEENPRKINECRKAVVKHLVYTLDHLEELEKGNNAEIDAVAELTYPLAYLYYLRLYTDYDQKVYTDKERKLANSLVNQYIDTAFEYLGSIASNTQDEAELLKAQKQAKEISRNLEEEVEIFVRAFADVVKEGKAK